MGAGFHGTTKADVLVSAVNYGEAMHIYALEEKNCQFGTRVHAVLFCAHLANYIYTRTTLGPSSLGAL